jgi:MFS family permease
MVSLGLPLWGTLATVCGQGIASAIFANAGRTVFQEQAPPSHRARVLSVYMFGFMGAAGLIGAPLSGVLVERIGPLTTCAVASGAMIVVVACAFMFTNIARVE